MSLASYMDVYLNLCMGMEGSMIVRDVDREKMYTHTIIYQKNPTTHSFLLFTLSR